MYYHLKPKNLNRARVKKHGAINVTSVLVKSLVGVDGTYSSGSEFIFLIYDV